MKTISCLIPHKSRGRKFIQIIVKLRVIPQPLSLSKLLKLIMSPRSNVGHNLGFLEVLTHKMVISYIAMTNGIGIHKKELCNMQDKVYFSFVNFSQVTIVGRCGPMVQYRSETILGEH